MDGFGSLIVKKGKRRNVESEVTPRKGAGR